MNSFEKLIRREQGFSLPHLIYLYDDEKTMELRFVNKTDSRVVHGGYIYQPCEFNYKANISAYGFDGGGKLEITTKGNQVIDLVENFESIHLEVIGVMNEQGEITELEKHKHHFGNVTVNRRTVTFTFEKDDRLEMTFPTLIWSVHNNKGNS